MATLSYAERPSHASGFHGDTLYAASTVSETGPVLEGHGAVTLETRAVNQNGDLVLSLLHKIMIPAKVENPN